MIYCSWCGHTDHLDYTERCLHDGCDCEYVETDGWNEDDDYNELD